MNKISVTEFRKKLNYYIDLSKTEEIAITQYGKVIAILSNGDKQYFKTLTKLCGCLKDSDTDENYKDMIGEEIIKRR